MTNYDYLINQVEEQCETSRSAIAEVEWLLLNYKGKDQPWTRPLSAACQLVLKYTEDVIPELIAAIKDLQGD